MNEKQLKRIEELKHSEELLGNCISYLWEIWNNVSCDEILESFKRLGFNDEDLLYWEISTELEQIKRESEEE